jgi:transcriptional regulator with XRE-family HTH domain
LCDRQKAELTQEKLAEKTGYSVEFISVVERGINAPSVEGCARIAKALRIELKDLFDF